MALTITRPAVGDRVGPGYGVDVSVSAGPIPIDDFISVTVRVHSTANSLDEGSVSTKGLLASTVIIGIDPFFLNKGGLLYSVAVGASVDLIAVQWHANGTLVDAVTLSGCFWDPTGGAFILTELLSLSNGGLLAKIFAAVSKDMPSLP